MLKNVLANAIVDMIQHIEGIAFVQERQIRHRIFWYDKFTPSPEFIAPPSPHPIDRVKRGEKGGEEEEEEWDSMQMQIVLSDDEEMQSDN